MAGKTVRQGFLCLKTSRIHQPYRKYFFVLKVNKEASRVQLDYYTDSDLASSRKRRTIRLESALVVERRVAHRPYAFHIHMSGSHCKFACASEVEADTWVDAIKEAIENRGVSKPSNDTFAVAIDPSPASRKAKLAGSCLMEVTSYDIVLWKKSERHRQTLQEILRCPIMSMVDSSCQALENQEYNHIINLQLASDVYQGSFFFQCVDGPGLLQAISSSRVKHSDDRGPQPLPRRTYSADLLALRDEDSVWQARKSLEQRPLSYSCENIVDDCAAAERLQSGPPVAPRASSPNEDLYAQPRCLSTSRLASRFQVLSQSNDDVYFGDDQFQHEEKENCRGGSLLPPVPSTPPPHIRNTQSLSELRRAGGSSPCSPISPPLSAPACEPDPLALNFGAGRHAQPRGPCEKKAEAKVSPRHQNVNSPRNSPVLVTFSRDGAREPAITTGPPTMPRPMKTLSPSEQAFSLSWPRAHSAPSIVEDCPKASTFK